LQWTREGLREFRVPIVLWVTHRILREISRQAPDFWSWRKAVLRFVSQETEPILVRHEERSQSSQPQSDNAFLPPLEELLSEIKSLESSTPESPNLATLYDQLGQVYAKRIASGKAANLEQERQQTIEAFQKAIYRYQASNSQAALLSLFIELGNFLDDQSLHNQAILAFQRSLEISREIGNRNGEAASLNNLGNAYKSLGQHSRAIDFYQQSLEMMCDIGDRNGEANSLMGLGNAYHSLGQYQRAIDFYQQSLEIKRDIGDRNGEAASLIGLGNAYDSLGQYQRAIELYQQSLEIEREIGDRNGEACSLHSLGNVHRALEHHQRAIDLYQQSLEIFREVDHRHYEANALFCKALALAKYEPRRFEAFTTLQQARTIYTELKLDYRVEQCDEQIYSFNQTIATEQRQSAPAIPSKPKNRIILKNVSGRDHIVSGRDYVEERKINLVFWFGVGLAIVLLIAWLRK